MEKLDRFLYQLAAPTLDFVTIDRLKRLQPSQIDILLDAAKVEKVFLPIAQRLNEVDDGSWLAPQVKLEFIKRRTLQDELRSVLQRLSDSIVREPIEVGLVKGFATASEYPPGYARDFGDADVIVPDLRTFWSVFRLLQKDGFVIVSLTLRQDALTGVVSGGSNVARQSRACDNEICSLDFLIGGQLLRPHSVVPFTEDFWKSSRAFAPPLSEFCVPSRVANILILLGETIERERLSIRDCLDMMTLAGPCDDEEWIWIGKMVHRFALWRECRMFVSVRANPRLISADVWQPRRQA
jgi:hypothetical protein